MSNIYVVTGASGSGKTTIAQAIAKQGEWRMANVYWRYRGMCNRCRCTFDR